jgi:hypothetical protein
MDNKEDTTPLPPGTIIQTRSLEGVAEEYHEKFCKLTDNLGQYAEEYSFFVLNTLHVYLRVKQNLFELYCNEYDVSINPVHFELPCTLLEENIKPAIGEIAPELGWSRYVQALPKDEFEPFRDWLAASKWRGKDAKGRVVIYDVFEEQVSMRDPVKLSTKQPVDLKERLEVSFFLPGNGSGALKLNLKNGPPYPCCYVARVNVKDHKDPFGVNIFKALTGEGNM